MSTRIGNKKSNVLHQQSKGSKTTTDRCPFCGKSEFSSVRGAKIHIFYCRSKVSPEHENNSRELVKKTVNNQNDNINEGGNQTRICDICNKTSDNLRALVVHKITEHGIGTRPSKIPEKSAKEMCNICGQNFDGAWGLFLHRAKTHGISKSSQLRASMKSLRKGKKSLLEAVNAESSSTIPESSCGPEESLNLNETRPTNHGYDGRENPSDLIISNQLQSNPNGETDTETALLPDLDATNKDMGRCTFCGKTGFNTSRAVSVHSYYCQKKRISRKKKKTINISKRQALGKVSRLRSGDTSETESGAGEPIGSTKPVCPVCNRIFASPWGLLLHQAKAHSTSLKHIDYVENMSGSDQRPSKEQGYVQKARLDYCITCDRNFVSARGLLLHQAKAHSSSLKYHQLAVSSLEPSFAVTQDLNRLQDKQRCSTTFSRVSDAGKMVSNQGERILQQLTFQRVPAQASMDQSVVSCLDSSINQLPDDWVSNNHQSLNETSGQLTERGITSNVEDVSIKVEVDSVSMFEEAPGGEEGLSEWQKDSDKRIMDEAARSAETEQNSPFKTCDICSKSFQNFRGVLTHKLRVHRTISLSQHLLGQNSKISKTKKVRRCIFCGKGGFSSGRTAKMHMLFCKKKNFPETNNRSIMQESVINEPSELHRDGSKEPVMEQTNKSRMDCDICAKQFKNFRGLHIHQARSHGSSVLIRAAELDSQQNSYQEKTPQGLDGRVEPSVQQCTVPTTKSSTSCSEYNLSSSEVSATQAEAFGNNNESVENISERDSTNDMLGIVMENEVDSLPAFDSELTLVGKTLCLWQNDLNEEIIGETVGEVEEVPHCSKDDNEEFQRSLSITFPDGNLIVQNVYSERQLDPDLSGYLTKQVVEVASETQSTRTVRPLNNFTEQNVELNSDSQLNGTTIFQPNLKFGVAHPSYRTESSVEQQAAV
ncbi:uncharacterized protein LOC106462112 isoform X2 [Limulus polyphemus]|uniref:Uncharacterized protein LOC106462112 isoform X2 n=1 Tax=Limulus polyphemus TaxID=6850 RepID=A0ABM1SMV6_LIMPO|nr:uncharacterized protein LOC106462112 isoform X2 [Limulus polyphemus]